MDYKYNCGNEVIRVWVWNDDFHTEVSVTDNKTKKTYERTIREDEGGKFFTWNKNKIYLDNWIRITMKELKDKIDRKEWCTDSEFCQAIMTDGVDSVRFIVPLNTISMKVLGLPLADGDDFKDVLCKIKEDYLHEVKNNYKLQVIPVEPTEDTISRREFYTGDMLGLIKSGIIKIVA